MNKSMLVITLVAMAVSVGFAEVGDSYSSVRIGGGSLDTTVSSDVDFDNGMGVSLLYGFHASEYTSLEIEVSYQNNQAEEEYGNEEFDIGVKQAAIMFNGRINAPAIGIITPYIFGGTGIAYVTASEDYTFAKGTVYEYSEHYEESAVAFTYQLGLGTEVIMNDKVSADVGVRYTGITEADYGYDEDIGFDSVQVYAGLSLKL
jgi:opacity protein-like surface antigen